MFEADCRDVHAAIAAGDPDFVLLDMQDPALCVVGHIAGAMKMSANSGPLNRN